MDEYSREPSLVARFEIEAAADTQSSVWPQRLQRRIEFKGVKPEDNFIVLTRTPGKGHKILTFNAQYS